MLRKWGRVELEERIIKEEWGEWTGKVRTGMGTVNVGKDKAGRKGEDGGMRNVGKRREE